MKSILLKFLLVINLFFVYNCKAQTSNDYVTFYNSVVPKLNTIAINKTQFYNQNFSIFYSELLNKNLNVVGLSYGTKTDPGIKYYIVRLFFAEPEMWSTASNNSFQYPWVSITFEIEIPSQIKSMVLQSQGEWNATFTQFFSNMKIEKIDFVGVNGYDSNDWSGK